MSTTCSGATTRSLHWLLYLAHRLDAIPIRVAVASRPGEQDSPQALRAGASAALDRGDPSGATALLERALAEPPPLELRPQVLRELGRARLATGEADALAPDVQRRASLLGFVQASSFRAYLEWFAGDLPAAAAAASDVLNATREAGAAGMNSVAVAVLVDVFAE